MMTGDNAPGRDLAESEANPGKVSASHHYPDGKLHYVSRFIATLCVELNAHHPQ